MKRLLLLPALCLAGCAPDAPDPNHIDLRGKTEDASAIFSVEYAGTFPAARRDRASQRSIYIITDKATGIKYMAVEGCGTAQLVTVSTGKTSHTEEQ